MMRPRYALRTLTPAVLLTAGRCLSLSTGGSTASTGVPRRAFAQASSSSSSSLASSATTTTNAADVLPTSIPPESLAAVQDLEPQPLWSYFAALSSIPRPSKHESAVLTYVKTFADKHGLRWTEDRIGNLCVFRPGSGGGQDAPPVIIQGHVDMVTEKNSDSDHDFYADPIRLRRFETEDGHRWVGARGTTLGADNGIGVAAALTLLSMPADDDDATPLPPLEALFTVDEETGLTGAMDLDAATLELTGRTMLNLDTEEWGDLYVGCAGGGESEITVPLKRVVQEQGGGEENDVDLVELRVDGLMGGHSGINIHEGRANAVLLCAAAARAALAASGGRIGLVSISGGDKHNAIPREAVATLAVPRSSPEPMQTLEAIAAEAASAALTEYGSLETNLRVRVVGPPVNSATDGGGSAPSSCPNDAPLDGPSAERLPALLIALPHGPLKFSHTIPDLVETSSNVASVVTGADSATVLCSTRSSIGTALESVRDRIAAVSTLAGATVERSDPYPGWNPNPDSPILGLARDLLRDRLREEGNGGGDAEPGVKAIHAGLECGLLIDKMGGEVDVLSFGPTIEGAHSPDERVNADTVGPFFGLVRDILSQLALARR